MLLDRISRGGQATVADPGVAARHLHLFNDKDVRAGLTGFYGCAQAGDATANNENIGLFIPLGHADSSRLLRYLLTFLRVAMA